MIDFQDMTVIINELIKNKMTSIWIRFFEIVWFVSREKNVVVLHFNDIEIISSVVIDDDKWRRKYVFMKKRMFQRL